MTAPVLVLEGARLEDAAGPRCPRVSVELRGPRIVLSGAASVLAEPLLGRAEVTEGTYAVAGVPLAEALPIVGLAPLDPPLVDDFSALVHVSWGARLGGADDRAARRLAEAACRRAGARTRRP